MANRLAICAAAIALLSGCSLSASQNEKTATKAPSNSCQPGADKGQSPAQLDQIQLCIKSADKERSFIVELARTPAEQAKGMMHRTSLADDRGMLFPYSKAQPLSFWMKNTLIPLDIIYIRADGSIESIITAEPLSLESLPSGEPVIAALELRGGLAAEKGIKIGDIVRWSK